MLGFAWWAEGLSTGLEHKNRRLWLRLQETLHTKPTPSLVLRAVQAWFVLVLLLIMLLRLTASPGGSLGFSGAWSMGPYEPLLLMGPKCGQDTKFHNSKISCWHLTENLCLCSLSTGTKGEKNVWSNYPNGRLCSNNLITTEVELSGLLWISKVWGFMKCVLPVRSYIPFLPTE